MPEPELVLRRVELTDPAAVALIAAVQAEYVVRYGGEDATPVDPGEFAPPHGLFLVGYLEGAAVACGGWRAHDGDERFAEGDAEIKRMYVAPSARGRGVARMVLAELERTAIAAGRTRLVLETSTALPEAMALYTSSGYVDIPPYGLYRGVSNCRCYGKKLG